MNKLNRESGTFTHYYVKDGLPSNAVSCILEDQFEMLWMSTGKGISRFDPVTQAIREHYSTVDGLPGNDFTGWDACFKSPSGEMFFGGFSGGVSFFSENVINSLYPLPLVFTDFQLAGKSISVGSHSPLNKSISYATDVTLSHDQNVFSLTFAARTFFNPDANRYRYKLDGVDSDWVEVGKRPKGRELHDSAIRHIQIPRSERYETKRLEQSWSDAEDHNTTAVVEYLVVQALLRFSGSLRALESLSASASASSGREVRARTEERLGPNERGLRVNCTTLLLQSVQGSRSCAFMRQPNEYRLRNLHVRWSRMPSTELTGASQRARSNQETLRLTSEPMETLTRGLHGRFQGSFSHGRG